MTGVPHLGLGYPATWDWGTPTCNYGTPRPPGSGIPLPPPGNGYPPGRDLAPVTRVFPDPRKDRESVEVLWDGVGYPPESELTSKLRLLLSPIYFPLSTMFEIYNIDMKSLQHGHKTASSKRYPFEMALRLTLECF